MHHSQLASQLADEMCASGVCFVRRKGKQKNKRRKGGTCGTFEVVRGHSFVGISSWALVRVIKLIFESVK